MISWPSSAFIPSELAAVGVCETVGSLLGFPYASLQLEPSDHSFRRTCYASKCCRYRIVISSDYVYNTIYTEHTSSFLLFITKEMQPETAVAFVRLEWKIKRNNNLADILDFR